MALTGISLDRVKTVIQKMKMVGFYTSIQETKKAGIISTKTLSDKIFHALGLRKQFRKDQSFARSKVMQLKKKIEEKTYKLMNLAISIKSKIAGKLKRKPIKEEVVKPQAKDIPATNISAQGNRDA